MQFVRRFFVLAAISLLVQWLSWPSIEGGAPVWVSDEFRAAIPFVPSLSTVMIITLIVQLLVVLAATLVWQRTGALNSRPLRWWLIMTLVGLLWALFFFGLHNLRVGHALSLLYMAAIVAVAAIFFKTDRRAGWLVIPLAIWVNLLGCISLYWVTLDAQMRWTAEVIESIPALPATSQDMQ